MTAAPGQVNTLVEAIMERLHSAVLDGEAHTADGDSPTLTEVLDVSGLMRAGIRVQGAETGRWVWPIMSPASCEDQRTRMA